MEILVILVLGWTLALTDLQARPQEHPVTGNVLRPHQGVIFYDLGSVTPTDKAWTHTWVLPVPDLGILDIPLPEIHCNVSSVENCDDIMDLFVMIRNLRHQAVNSLQHLPSDLRDVFPGLRLPPRGRRALFSFIGRVSHYLFGTVGEEELNPVIDQVNKLSGQVNQNTEQVKQLGNQLGSFVHLSILNTQYMERIINHTRQDMANLASYVGLMENRQYRLQLVSRSEQVVI
jgi:hypothetical protein